jgi:hypothetical protein
VKRKEVIIDIGPDGELCLETTGYSGPDCERATRELEAALGKVEQTTRTPEFYQPVRAQQRH